MGGERLVALLVGGGFATLEAGVWTSTGFVVSSLVGALSTIEGNFAEVVVRGSIVSRAMPPFLKPLVPKMHSIVVSLGSSHLVEKCLLPFDFASCFFFNQLDGEWSTF